MEDLMTQAVRDDERDKTLDEVEKSLDENTYCIVCGNGIINGRCISHPESLLMINRPQFVDKLKSMRK